MEYFKKDLLSKIMKQKKLAKEQDIQPQAQVPCYEQEGLSGILKKAYEASKEKKLKLKAAKLPKVK